MGVITLLCLLLSSPAYAQSLTLPQPFRHDGLTFSSPLTYEKSSHLSLKPISLEFGTIDEIDVHPTSQQQVAIEAIVTPTPSPISLIETPSASKITEPKATPTPTVLPRSTPKILLSTTPPPTLTSLAQVITPPSNPGGLNADILFTMVNSYRATKALPAFQKDDKSCSLAASRAPEIGHEIATNTMHSGLRSRNLPYWNTENIISMGNEDEAFNWWIHDQIHKDAIESNNTYSCIACEGFSCTEEFTNYQPK